MLHSVARWALFKTAESIYRTICGRVYGMLGNGSTLLGHPAIQIDSPELIS